VVVVVVVGATVVVVVVGATVVVVVVGATVVVVVVGATDTTLEGYEYNTCEQTVTAGIHAPLFDELPDNDPRNLVPGSTYFHVEHPQAFKVEPVFKSLLCFKHLMFVLQSVLPQDFGATSSLIVSKNFLDTSAAFSVVSSVLSPRLTIR